MRSYFCTRVHRRFVVRYFGGTRNLLLWVLAVSLTVYIVDSYLFGSGTDNLDDSSSDNVKRMDQPMGEKKPEPVVVPSPSKNHLETAAPSRASQTGSSSQSSTVCTEQPQCPDGEYPYYIRSGVGRDGSPVVCFNGHYGFNDAKKNAKRGVNMMVINGKTMQVEDVRQFDTYEDDSVLIRYFRLGIEDGHIVLIATQDDASAHLLDESKAWFRVFGSNLIGNLKFRDSFVMLGQRGLVNPGSAKEQLVSRDLAAEYGGAAELKGCAKFPLGELKPADSVMKPAPQPVNDAAADAKVPGGQAMSNCGVPEKCDPDHIAVHLFTGKDNTAGPRMCIDGTYIFDANVNNAGRGINVALYDTTGAKVIRATRFDTYESADDSANLAKLLNGVTTGQLVIAVSHDDMITALSEDAQKALEMVGSSYSKQIAFRDAWIFVGQGGLGGFSPIEEIEFGGPDQWPTPIDKKFCVPKKLTSIEKKRDVSQKKNAPKRVFCRKYDGYEDFCKGPRLDEHLTPAPQTDDAMKNHPIYSIPIAVIPGLSHLATLQQFEAILSIPGIDPKLVTIMYDIKFEESGLLADFFSFSKVQLESSTKYIYLIEKALDEVWKLNPDAKYVILLEEEVIPTRDFLNYLAQCMDALDKDETLIGATAWNENGFDTVSSMPTVVYRGNSFPGLGFMLKKSFYTESMKGKMGKCCLRRSWYGWFVGENQLSNQEVIIPDVSRVSRRQFMGLTENVEYVRAYFGRPRNANSELIKLANVDDLVSNKYDESIDSLLSSGVPLLVDKSCAFGQSKELEGKGKTYVVYYEQESASDETTLLRLCQCFKLFYSNNYPAKGLHKGVLRFTFKENHVLLVGSSSPFYKFKPSSQPALKKSDIV